MMVLLPGIFRFLDASIAVLNAASDSLMVSLMSLTVRNLAIPPWLKMTQFCQTFVRNDLRLKRFSQLEFLLKLSKKLFLRIRPGTLIKKIT